MTAFAPIAVFAYKRAAHLERTLSALKRCEGFNESKIILFGDGAKTSADASEVDATRRVARDQLGSHAEYHFSDQNLGLSASIIAGVNELTSRYGRIIVVEDDLEVAADFLSFLNAALNRYDRDERVMQISGHMFDTPGLRQGTSAVLLPFTTTWGWATWRRAWSRFDPLARGWERLRIDAALRTRFNLENVYDYASMLEQQMAGRRDSWGIRWYWSVFRNDGLVCFPPVSLVRNFGMDGTGTHGRGLLRRFSTDSASDRTAPLCFPDISGAVDEKSLSLVREAIRRHNGGWAGAVMDYLRRRIRRLGGRGG